MSELIITSSAYIINGDSPMTSVANTVAMTTLAVHTLQPHIFYANFFGGREGERDVARQTYSIPGDGQGVPRLRKLLRSGLRRRGRGVAGAGALRATDRDGGADAADDDVPGPSGRGALAAAKFPPQTPRSS